MDKETTGLKCAPETDPNAIVEGQDVQLQEIECTVERQDVTVGVVADIGRQPHQLVVDAELLRESRDRRVALEQVMVENLDAGVVERNGGCLAAEATFFP